MGPRMIQNCDRWLTFLVKFGKDATLTCLESFVSDSDQAAKQSIGRHRYASVLLMAVQSLEYP